MIFILFVAAAIAALTWLLGWWGVLVVALVIGFVFRAEGGGGWRIAVAAALAWLALLAVDAASGPVGLVGTRLAGVMRVPAAVLVVVTLLFPALLAWSAATTVAMALGRRISPPRRSGP
jgi:hypothetical protein